MTLLRGRPEKQKPRRRIWVQHVAVDVRVLEIRLGVAAARGLKPSQKPVLQGVTELLTRARLASERLDPIPGRILNWWRGTLVEAAYRHLHAAHVQIVDLFDEDEMDAEIPGAVARAHSTLHRDDPRCISQEQLRAMSPERRRAWLRRLIEDGYEAIDLKHAQLRSFRNNVLMSAAVVICLVGVTVGVVADHPSAIPLCFPNETTRESGDEVVVTQENLNCPTSDNTKTPSGGDILVVALLGLLGGTLAASIAIRKLQGTSTAYDVPVALAWLKVPLGAFTAILGLVAIQGDFVPGLTVLDSQEQILAYALVLGFAQQAFTGVLDRKAQELAGELPSKDAQIEAKSAPQTSASTDLTRPRGWGRLGARRETSAASPAGRRK